MSATTGEKHAPPTDSHFGAKLFVDEIRQRFPDRSDLKILIAGCGSGHEACYIREALAAEVHSIDVEDFLEVPEQSRAEINFQISSVCELPFEENEFDAVFYYHVIEHVDRPQESLFEINRVTKSEGWVFIGTPNRNRILSSIGAHKQCEWDPTIWNKLSDNIRDWKHRITGKFHNRFGAHAGFTTGELDRMARKVFRNTQWVTQQYIRGKYRHHRLAVLINLLTSRPLNYVVAPSIYVWCQKRSA